MPKKRCRLEVGARTLDDVLAAERGGADRVELYSSPLEGALTPGAGLIRTAAAAVSTLELFVMIRPRAGDFLYSANEFETMRRDVEIAVELGAHGIMCGILKPDGALDGKRMADLKQRAGAAKFVLHRAFDFSQNPRRTLEEAIDLGCDYILTLGQERDAAFDRDTLREILERAGDRTRVVLAFGAEFDTAAELRPAVEELGGREYHIVNGYRRRRSAMETLRAATENDDYLKDAMASVDYLSEEAVRECRLILDEYGKKTA
jgi:copper homeostasis protein